MPDRLQPPAELTPEQWAFLAEFSGHYVAGRRILCWIARSIVALGMVCGALAGVAALIHALVAGR